MLENYGGLQINSLNNILSSNNDEVPDVIQQSNYYDQESLAGVFTINISSFNIVSLNCQSIKAKIDEIKIKIKQWESVNCSFDAIEYAYRNPGYLTKLTCPCLNLIIIK